MRLGLTLRKPTLCASSTRIATYAGDYDQVEGILVLEVFVNDTNLAHKFYVMKPKRMVSPIILGQPWQRQYNCRVNWKKEGIQYEDNDHEWFEPFLGEDSYAYSDSDESDRDASSSNTLNSQLKKGKGKLEELTDTPLPISKSMPDKPTACLTKSNKSNSTTTAPLKKSQWKWVPKHAKPETQVTTTHPEQSWHNPPLCQQQPYKTKPDTSQSIWVPKKLLQAQAGSLQIWIPKRTPKEAEPTPTTKKRKAKSHKRKPRQPMPNTHTTKNGGYGNQKRLTTQQVHLLINRCKHTKLPPTTTNKNQANLAAKEHNADLGSGNPTHH